MPRFIAVLTLLLTALRSPAERINQEGRILGAPPVVTNSILFDTSNADAVVSAMQIFPATNPWNNQTLVSNLFVDYPDESDLNGGIYPFGLYPTPMNQPIEEWPTGMGSQTLLQWQTNNDGSDRHSIVVQPSAGLIYETWMALRSGTN